jgi:multiple sugar transport system permease protein
MDRSVESDVVPELQKVQLRSAVKSVRSIVHCLAAAIDRNLALVFLMPGVLLLLLILTYPILSNLVLSTTDAHLLYPKTHWVGVQNFRTVLRDSDFWNAAYNSVLWTVGSISLQLVLGLVAALMLDQKIRARGIFRSLMIIPYAFPPITMALLWKWMLSSMYGIYNHILVWLGVIHQPISWFLDPTLAMITAIGVNVWFGYPLMMLAILAGLQTIPREFYEVAEIEGASYLQTLRFVILPSVAKIIGIMVVLRTIWVSNSFDLLFLLTGGGPITATETLPLYIYRTGWQVYQIGRTAAIGVLLSAMLGLLITFYFRVMRLEEDGR